MLQKEKCHHRHPNAHMHTHTHTPLTVVLARPQLYHPSPSDSSCTVSSTCVAWSNGKARNRSHHSSNLVPMIPRFLYPLSLLLRCTHVSIVKLNHRLVATAQPISTGAAVTSGQWFSFSFLSFHFFLFFPSLVVISLFVSIRLYVKRIKKRPQNSRETEFAFCWNGI